MKNSIEFSVEGLSGYYDSERELFIADEIGGVDVVEWPDGTVRFSNVPVDIACAAVKTKNPVLFLQSQGYCFLSNGDTT